MEVLTRTNGREMTLAIKGELDHHGARDAMRQIEYSLDAALPSALTLDFSGVSFMDSSGIAVVLRAHRRMASLGAALSLQVSLRRQKRCSMPRAFRGWSRSNKEAFYEKEQQLHKSGISEPEHQ